MRVVGKLLFGIALVAVVRTRAKEEEEEEGEEDLGEIGEVEDEFAPPKFDDTESKKLEADLLEFDKREAELAEAEDEVAPIEREVHSEKVLHNLHAKADSDGSGKVSFAELIAYTDKIRNSVAVNDTKDDMQRMDKDKDGKVSFDELLTTEWESVDSDKDMQDKEDYTEELAALKEIDKLKFKAADGDKDGFLDMKELQDFYHPENHDAILRITTLEELKHKDTDDDGKLSKNEFWGFNPLEEDGVEIPDEDNAEFVALDKNGDGFIDLEELMVWESGRLVTEDSLKKLLEIADADKDEHVTATELVDAREKLAESDAQGLLNEWAEHEQAKSDEL